MNCRDSILVDIHCQALSGVGLAHAVTIAIISVIQLYFAYRIPHIPIIVSETKVAKKDEPFGDLLWLLALHLPIDKMVGGEEMVLIRGVFFLLVLIYDSKLFQCCMFSKKSKTIST